MGRSHSIGVSARRNAPVLIQGIAALSLIAGLHFLPPARGAMTYVPLTHDAATGMVRVALRGDARLLGQTTSTGAVTVSGERPNLWQMLMNGVLVVSAEIGTCGQ